MAQQKDKIVEIANFGSMNSYIDPRFIADNQFQVLVNAYHVGSKIRRRPSNKRILNNTTHGSHEPVGMGIFTPNTGSILITFALDNGQCWECLTDGTSETQILQTTTLTAPFVAGNRVSFAQFLNEHWVADQDNFYFINHTTNRTIAFKQTKLLDAPNSTGINNPYKLVSYQNRLWVADRLGTLAGSQQEADIDTDTDPFDSTTAGVSGFLTPVSQGDGQLTTGLTASTSVMVINKSSIQSTEFRGSQYKIVGTSEADFALKQVNAATGYLGDSGVAVGRRILGLTSSKFDFIETIERGGDSIGSSVANTVTSIEEEIIPDWIKDIIENINITEAARVVDIYDPRRDAYYCAIPYGENANKNNLVIRIDFSDNQIRFSVHTMFAQFFIYVNGFIHFIDDRGVIWRAFDEDQTTYEEPTFHTLVITKAYNMGAVSAENRYRSITPTIKLFTTDQTTRKRLDIYYNVWHVDRDTGAIKYSTDKHGVDFTASEIPIVRQQSFYPPRFGSFFLNYDNLNNRIFDTFRKELTPNIQGDYIQLIISDDSQDTDGAGRWELSSLILKGQIQSESL